MIMEEVVIDIKNVFGVDFDDKIEDMYHVVNMLGGEIEKTRSVDNNILGLVKNGSKFKIRVKDGYDSNVERFIIAVCLGELFLCMRYSINSHKWSSFNDEETFINYSQKAIDNTLMFAISFLLPRKKFIGIMSSSYLGNEVYNLKKVASYFNVPYNVVLWRAKELGMVSY